MKVSNTIKSILSKEDISLTELAGRLDMSVNNLSNKLRRDNFKLEELELIAEKIGYELNLNFVKLDSSDDALNKKTTQIQLSDYFASSKSNSLAHFIDEYLEAALHEQMQEKLEGMIKENIKSYYNKTK